MMAGRKSLAFFLSLAMRTAMAQVPEVTPHVMTKADAEGSVTVVEVATHFVTAIRMPETVNSVVVGDPTQFQVEHSDREPELVFIKALTPKPAETNLLISTTRGHEVSLLVLNRGEETRVPAASVDFLVKYKSAGGFLIEPDYPSELVGETISVGPGSMASAPVTSDSVRSGVVAKQLELASPVLPDPPSDPTPTGLGELLARQERAPIPALFGEHVAGETATKDHLLTGASEVVDSKEQVIVLFSAVNPTDHNILLMPPQIQLGGKVKSGKIIHRSHWTTAEQIPIKNFLLSKRRLAPGERADGVVVFERPPYKQSNQTLLLQIADAGAVDRPALAPIGFGINTSREESSHGRPQAER